MRDEIRQPTVDSRQTTVHVRQADQLDKFPAARFVHSVMTPEGQSMLEWVERNFLQPQRGRMNWLTNKEKCEVKVRRDGVSKRRGHNGGFQRIEGSGTLIWAGILEYSSLVNVEAAAQSTTLSMKKPPLR